MDNKLQIFKNEEFGEVRVLTKDGQPYFVGKDVAERLDYKESNKAVVRHVDEDDRIKHPIIDNLGREQQTWLINESGLYSLVLSSKLPSAKSFKRWVTSEVLPSIRQNGGYIISNEEDDAETIMAKALIVAQKTIDKKNQLLAAKNEELKEKDDFINKISSSKTSILVRELAHIISDQYFKIGEYKLVDKLREFNLIYKNSREPYQKRIEQGLFEVAEFPIKTNHGVILKKTTKITGKGQAYIINKLLKELN